MTATEVKISVLTKNNLLFYSAYMTAPDSTKFYLKFGLLPLKLLPV